MGQRGQKGAYGTNGTNGTNARRWAVATVAYGVTAWSEMRCVYERLAGYQFIDILGITSSSLEDQKGSYSYYGTISTVPTINSK